MVSNNEYQCILAKVGEYILIKGSIIESKNLKCYVHEYNNNNNNDLLEKDGGTKNCIYN